MYSIVLYSIVDPTHLLKSNACIKLETLDFSTKNIYLIKFQFQFQKVRKNLL